MPVGPGDDCAVVRCGREKLLITTDQVLDGVHFILTEHGPRAAGRKAMARNLSDIAAMAGAPLAAVACLTLPKGMGLGDCQAIYEGMRELADRFNCPVVGGDVGAWKGPLAISVTIVGRPRPAGPILRSGAKVGDAVFVTGALGGAWKTRRHLEFTPRLDAARRLARRFAIHAMIDISDGLAVDLGHLCRASGVGARLVAADIPIHPDAAGLCHSSGNENEIVPPSSETKRSLGVRSRPTAPTRAGLRAALEDGEDYELLFTLPARQARSLAAARGLGVPVRRIGTITAGRRITMLEMDGKIRTVTAKGWEHET